MKTRGSSNVRQRNGHLSQRKQTVKPCAICGWNFMGRAEVKACSPECTKALRKFSARNRTPAHQPNPSTSLMNSVNIIGRVGGDIELRYAPSGKAVAQVTLAVDDGWGENKKTAWIGVTIWGATAELAKKAVRKGDRLGITGRLSQEEWDDKETGKKQRKTKVTCDSMHLLEPKRDDSGQVHPREQAQPGRRMSQEPPAQPTQEDEDIPF